MSAPVIHTCSCGRTFTRAEWDALDRLRNQPVPADGTEPAYELDLRQCPCGSTRARKVPANNDARAA